MEPGLEDSVRNLADAAVLCGNSVLLLAVVAYPAMLWVAGGRWWGLAGMVFHVALLLKGVFQVRLLES